ncbi:uncharacterized protein KRP23_11310 [Phytophthora ramorum]|uniref:uncharacterized protein n=1 Tax=Phytophthora ramorum TaxID=164328 RepID=UPI00309B468D|nr:hypothetical protein KRP23_11310 [Phytophthora ramorum]KAH7499195.1 hypothetical protein KRP22_10686 [Phytophthora ramorum]
MVRPLRFLTRARVACTVRLMCTMRLQRKSTSKIFSTRSDVTFTANGLRALRSASNESDANSDVRKSKVTRG